MSLTVNWLAGHGRDRACPGMRAALAWPGVSTGTVCAGD